jgi:hypothetical protein
MNKKNSKKSKSKDRNTKILNKEKAIILDLNNPNLNRKTILEKYLSI